MVEGSVRTVHIKSMQGEVRTVALPADSLVSELKRKVAEVFPVPAERQRLIFQGKLLKENSRLSEYVKEDGMTVHMMVKALEDSRPQADSQPPPQAPGFFPFGTFSSAPMIDAQSLFRQMGEMVNHVIPQDLQGMQLNFSGAGPLFQVLQRPQAAAPQAQPQVPVVPIPPDNPSNPLPEERRPVREFSLPFPNLYAIGQIVNSLTGPQSSFPSPPMPQLPFARNPLVLLGGFLYMYQFQLLRLLPFLARCGDLLQRESLLTDVQHRMELQTLIRAMGSALRELVQATEPVFPLFETIEIGPQPSQFHISLSSSSPSIAINTIPSAPSNPSRVMRDLSLFSLLTATETDLRSAGHIVTGLLDGVTLNDLGVLFEGNLSPLRKVRSALLKHVLEVMGGRDSLEGRRFVIGELVSVVDRYLYTSEFFENRFRPGFDYRKVTLEVAERTGEELISLLFDRPESEFASGFHDLFARNIGKWAETVTQNSLFGGQTLEQLLEAQLSNLLASSPRQSVRNLYPVLHPMAQSFLRTSLNYCQAPSSALIQTWNQVIESDTRAQSSLPSNRGLSRTYQSLSAFPRVPPADVSPQSLMNAILFSALQESGLEVRRTEIADDLADAFLAMLEESIVERSRTDRDFEAGRFASIQGLASRRRD